jgi:hypothetical protein
MRVALLMSLLTCLFTVVKPIHAAETAGGDLDNATKLYTSGKIQGALNSVDSILKANPKNAGALYLKANCLIQLQRLPEASHLYALVMHLAPGSKIAEHARKAVAQIQSVQSAGSRSKMGSRGTRSTLSIEEVNDADGASAEAPDEGSTTLPASSSVSSKTHSSRKPVPPGTLELIRLQAQKARERAISDGQAQADGEKKKAEAQARAEQERVERLANTGQNRVDQQAISGADIAALRSRAAANAEALKQLGDAKAAWKEREAQEKAEGLKQQAEELEEQLVNNDRNYKGRTVKLNPIGTNLYIRNYASARPHVKSLDAQARTLPAVTDGTETSASVGRGCANGQAKVSGTVNPAARGNGKSGYRAEVKLEGEVLPK